MCRVWNRIWHTRKNHFCIDTPRPQPDEGAGQSQIDTRATPKSERLSE